MDLEAQRRELEQLKARVEAVEAEIARTEASEAAPIRSYPTYYAASGFLLGSIATMASLLVNVVGAPLAGKNPLELIRVYLTFPLGEKALHLTETAQPVYAVGDGMILAFGCCLYLFTGMLIGIPLYLGLVYLAPRAGLGQRLIVASLLALGIWLFNFYGILSWLQPMLLGGDWILNPQYMPWWVAAVTHLVYGWTMALLYPYGLFDPYRRPTEAEPAPAV